MKRRSDEEGGSALVDDGVVRSGPDLGHEFALGRPLLHEWLHLGRIADTLLLHHPIEAAGGHLVQIGNGMSAPYDRDSCLIRALEKQIPGFRDLFEIGGIAPEADLKVPHDE